MIIVREPYFISAISPSAPQFTPYALPLKRENRRRQASVEDQTKTYGIYISLPILSPFIPVFTQTCLLPRMKTLYDHPYHLLTNHLSQGAPPTGRVAKCRAPHEHLSPWPLKGIQPSALQPLLSAMTAQPSRLGMR